MKLDWYFDFLSPFAYLQHELFLRRGVEVQRVPVLFAGLLKHSGGKGPAEIAAKRVVTYRHCQWLAAQMDLPFKFPPAHPFNPLPALRLAVACDARADAVTKIFRALYVEGMDVTDAAAWEKVAARLGVENSDALHEMISAQSVKDKLRVNTEAAIARGVFGVPTLFVGDGDDAKQFWGLDMTEMALHCAQHADAFSGGEYERLADLPVGQARKV